MFSNEKWFGASAPFYDETIDQSLRFQSAHLERTPSSASNQKTWTFSCWFKIGNTGANHTLWSAGATGTPRLAVYLSSGGQLITDLAGTGTYDQSVARFRDTTNWYHLVWAFDTTQATGSNRSRMYINGTEITLTKTRTFSLNTNYAFNGTVLHTTGGLSNSTGTFASNLYLAEVNFVDGTQLTPTSFGETKNGIWIPKDVSGLTYGTNGFRLTFADSSSIGDDTSGNTNDYSTTGLASTDVVLDSPTNNFCTLNPLNANYNVGQATFSEGNLRITSNSANRGFTTGTFKLTGKHYFEVYYKADNSGFIGIQDINNNAGGSTSGQSIHIYDGSVRIDGSSIGSVTTFSVGDVIGVEVDIDAKTIEFFKNGVSVSDNTYTTDAEYFPFIYDSSGGRVMDLIANFGQDASFAGNKTSGSDDASDSNGQGVFYETPSSGYLALCSSNLPDTTLSPNQTENASNYFSTVLYTGNATDDREVTGVGFKPDWGWFKERDDTVNHLIFDSSRGATKQLIVNDDASESTQANKQKTFTNDGYTLGTDGQVNGLNDLYVVWNWKANGGTTVSNTQGSITSTVQANTTAGFSIVQYTGDSTSNDGTPSTVGHGLNAVPKFIFTLPLDHFSGAVYHAGNTSAPETERLILKSPSGNAMTADDAGYWNDTAPTSTVFSIGTRKHTNSNGGVVAYVFAEIEGYSKFGSYTGNGNADGIFVYTGFRPAWLMIKRTGTSGTSGWSIFDNKRNTFNPVDTILQANTTGTDGTSYPIDFLSNGVKIRDSGSTHNQSGSPHIFVAFSDGQNFKFGNSR